MMRTVFSNTAVLVLVAGIAACSEQPAEPTQPIDTAPPEAATPAQITEDNQGVLTDAQRDGLNAANQASALLQQAEAERRKQLEAQGR